MNSKSAGPIASRIKARIVFYPVALLLITVAATAAVVSWMRPDVIQIFDQQGIGGLFRARSLSSVYDLRKRLDAGEAISRKQVMRILKGEHIEKTEIYDRATRWNGMVPVPAGGKREQITVDQGEEINIFYSPKDVVICLFDAKL